MSLSLLLLASGLLHVDAALQRKVFMHFESHSIVSNDAEPSLGRIGKAHLLQSEAPTSGVPYWSGKNGDPLRTGSTSAVAPKKLEGGPTWSWIAPDNGLVRAAPLIDSERNVYLATIAGKVIKFAPNGAVIWTYNASASVAEVPVMDRGLLFFATTTGDVLSLDPSSGAEVWRVKVGEATGGDTWSMSAREGVVIAGACGATDTVGNKFVVALDAATGAEKWRFRPHQIVYNFLAAIKDGRVVFSDANGRAYMRDLQTGTSIWEAKSVEGTEIEGFTTGGAVIGADGVVYVTSNLQKTADAANTGRLSALRFSDGKKLWSADVPLEANNAAAVGRLGPDGKGPLTVVIGVGQNPTYFLDVLVNGPKPRAGQVMAFDAKTGLRRWSFSPPIWSRGSAAGDTLDHTCMPDSFSNPSIGGDGTVYIGFQDGLLYSLNEKVGADGQKVEVESSTWDSKNAFQGSVGIAPGMLVATPCNGMLVWMPSSTQSPV